MHTFNAMGIPRIKHPGYKPRKKSLVGLHFGLG